MGKGCQDLWCQGKLSVPKLLGSLHIVRDPREFNFLLL